MKKFLTDNWIYLVMGLGGALVAGVRAAMGA